MAVETKNAMDKVDAIVSEVVPECEDIQDAVNQVIYRLKGEGLWQSVVEDLARIGVNRKVGATRHELRKNKVSQNKQKTYTPNTSARDEVRQTHEEMVDLWDTYTVGDKRLRRTTKEELIEAAETHHSVAQGHIKVADFLESLAVEMGDGETVEDAYSAEEVESIHREKLC